MKPSKYLILTTAAASLAIALTGCATAEKKADCACPPEAAAAKAATGAPAAEHPSSEHPSEHPAAPDAAAAPKAE